MESLLQYLDEIDDAWYSIVFVAARPANRIYAMLAAALILSSCGTVVH